MKEYKYPDKNDSITCLFIDSNSNANYWADSEKNVLNMMIEKIVQLNSPPDFLDVGCGLGRLFSTFNPYVNSITALEPDYERFSQAKSEGDKIDKDKIKVINNDISSMNKEKFEVALISHIIQHIPFQTIMNIFDKLSEIIPSGGLVFLTTTYSNQPNDIFTLEYIKNEKHIAEVVSELEYNTRFYDNNILPVRYFSCHTIESLCLENNFVIEDMYAYHFDLSLTEETPSIEFDQKQNKEKLYNGAKDILYILRKK